MKKNIHLERFLRNCEYIPPLPEIAIRVIQLIDDEEVSAKELASLMSKDPGLTSYVLKICNSAEYGLPRTVSSISQALMYLGFHMVRNLVITSSLREYYELASAVYGYEEGGLWHHSLACAMVAESLCDECYPDLRDTAFTTGILHDLGQLVLGMKIGGSNESIEMLMAEEDITDLKAEQEVLGFSHDLLGGLLAYQWNLPTSMTLAIRFHHAPSESKRGQMLTGIIHLADAIALKLGYGVRVKQLVYPVKPIAMDMVGIDKTQIARVAGISKDRIEREASKFVASA